MLFYLVKVYFLEIRLKSKCITYKLEILRSVGIQEILIHSLPKEHLPLTSEVRLGN